MSGTSDQENQQVSDEHTPKQLDEIEDELEEIEKTLNDLLGEDDEDEEDREEA